MWKRRKYKKSSGIFKKIFPVIFILPVLALLLFLIKEGLFVVKKVEIENNQSECIDEKQLNDPLQLLGKNFLTLDQENLAKTLKEKFICIKDINLLRVLPNKVKVKIENRQPAAILVNLKIQPATQSSFLENVATPSAEDASVFWIVDNEGVIFSKKSDNLNIPKVFVYNLKLSLGEKLKSDFIVSCLKVLDKVRTLGLNVKESWANDNMLVVNSEFSGPKIVFGLNDKVDIQLASLQLILDKAKIDLKELEFIDLRFDKPVVRFAPKK